MTNRAQQIFKPEFRFGLGGLVGLSLLLGVATSLLAGLYAFVDREALPIKRQVQRRRTAS
jgi:hypothetical protein